MNKTDNLKTRAALVVCAVGMAACMANAQTVVLKDNFEAGTPPAAIPTGATDIWHVNDSGRPALYDSTNNPFPSGTTYAHINDEAAATGVGTRFMSTSATDPGGYGPKIGTKVTTFSFEFWETAADIVTGTNPGLGVGYYNPQATGTGIDLNSAGRSYRVYLHNGVLQAADSLVPDSGTALNYDRETVYTLYMLTNDSATAVENYRDNRTLAPQVSDIWLAKGTDDPIFAFSIANSSTTFSPWGVGFRTFTNDIEEFLIDDVLLVENATFDRSAFDAPAGVLGDYNGNGTVDAADYVLWRDTPAMLSNDSTPASVGPEDYDYWKSRFGATTNPVGSGGALGASNVPEPCTLVLLLPALCFYGGRRICTGS